MRYTLLLLKFAVTVALIFWLAAKIHTETLYQTLTVIELQHIVTGVLLHLLVILLGSIRWWILLGHVHEPITFGRVLPGYYLGVFSNNFLPSSMGGDAVRVLHLKLKGLSAQNMVSASLIDRAIGFLVVLIIGGIGLVFCSGLNLSTREKIFVVGTMVLVFGVAAALFYLAGLTKDHGRHRSNLVYRWLSDVITQCHSYKNAGTRLAIAITITFVAQSLIILTYYLLGRALEIELPLITYAAIVPGILLVTSVPISIGGLGVREGTLVALLLTAGVGNQQAIGLSFIYLSVLWLATLPGGLVLLTRAQPRTR